MDSRDIRSSFSAEIEDQVLAGKIEQLIQQNENISIPAVVMEYTSKENIDFDYIDMKNVNHFCLTISFLVSLEKLRPLKSKEKYALHYIILFSLQIYAERSFQTKIT